MIDTICGQKYSSITNFPYILHIKTTIFLRKKISGSQYISDFDWLFFYTNELCGYFFCYHLALQEHGEVVVLSDCGFPLNTYNVLYGKLWHVSVQ